MTHTTNQPPHHLPTHTVIPAKAGIHTKQPAPSNITPTPTQPPPVIPAKAGIQWGGADGGKSPLPKGEG